jgi:hypothetical protein
MEQPDKIILLAARDDGLLITIDGVSHLKEMSVERYFELARQCQEAGLLLMRRQNRGRSDKSDNTQS